MVQNAKGLAQNVRDPMSQGKWRGANDKVSHFIIQINYCPWMTEIPAPDWSHDVIYM